MDWALVSFVVAVVLVASTAQTVVGFGFALISVPVLVAVLDVRDTVVLETILGLVNSSLVARHAWRHVPWRTVSWMFVGSVAGMPFGLAVLLFTPQDALRLGVGVSTIVMVAALAAGLRLGASGVPRDLGVGLVSGVLNTSTSMNGPPVVLYFQGVGYPTQTFRGGLSVFFVAAGAVTLGAFIVTGVVTWLAVGLAAAAVPAVFAGSFAGHALLRRVEPELFRRLVFAMLVAAALSAVGSSMARILGG
jgi:uncharacterized membrane protein YfcA